MEGTRHKSDAPYQTYVIHLSFADSGVGTIALLYERLRFLLLGSKWVNPLGTLAWSALHVLLVVGGASYMVLHIRVWRLLLH